MLGVHELVEQDLALSVVGNYQYGGHSGLTSFVVLRFLTDFPREPRFKQLDRTSRTQRACGGRDSGGHRTAATKDATTCPMSLDLAGGGTGGDERLLSHPRPGKEP